MENPGRFHMLDAFPLFRSTNVDETCERMGRVFSPHRLQLRGGADGLQVEHNRVRLRDVSINVLRYGTAVEIDPGERGDFYMAQLPLSGSAYLNSDGQDIRVDADVLSVLQPLTRSRMQWSEDCTMLLVQVPRDLVHRRAKELFGRSEPRFAVAHSRRDPEVAAWWQVVLDLTSNIDRFGAQWLKHPAACASMEDFLVSGFTSMLGSREPVPQQVRRGDARCLWLAQEYVHAHPDRALTLAEIARHACVGPRTLESVFKRNVDVPPLVYARNFRLRAVRDALQAARDARRCVGVTEVALNHGFLHMGRFASQYRELFGCSPSETLRRRDED